MIFKSWHWNHHLKAPSIRYSYRSFLTLEMAVLNKYFDFILRKWIVSLWTSKLIDSKHIEVKNIYKRHFITTV